MSEAPTATVTDATATHAAEVARLHEEIQRRGAAIRGFETALAAERRQVAQARADLEHFVRRLAAVEDERDTLRRELEFRDRCKPTGFAAWLHARRRLPTGPEPAAARWRDLPGAEFTYYLNTSPYRLFRDAGFLLKGWAFPKNGEPVTALRARVDDAEFYGTYGLEEPSVIAHFGPQPHNPRPGFKIMIETPAGRHQLSLEARLGDGDWVSFLQTPLWAQPPA